MKRHILTLIAILTTMVSASAMSYDRARQEALYLTDKMAYELNLNDQQYNDAYEINLDYFMSMDSERDLYEDYLSYRLTDLRHILMSWQFDLLLGTDYFVRPLLWERGAWYLPVYAHYRRDMFFYDRPHVYFEYRGGHGHLHHRGPDFYADRRPRWDGGMRGRDMGRPERPDRRPDMGGGNGYHFDLPGRDNRPAGRDNAMNDRRNDLQDGRGNARPGTRGYSIGREGTRTPDRSGYTSRGDDSNRRQYQGAPSRSTDRSYSVPDRNSSTRYNGSRQPVERGNSFNRSSSRVTTGTGSYGTPSRGSSVSRGSSSMPSRGGSVGAPTRGGASEGSRGGGSVSRGRR